MKQIACTRPVLLGKIQAMLTSSDDTLRIQTPYDVKAIDNLVSEGNRFEALMLALRMGLSVVTKDKQDDLRKLHLLASKLDVPLDCFLRCMQAYLQTNIQCVQLGRSPDLMDERLVIASILLNRTNPLR